MSTLGFLDTMSFSGNISADLANSSFMESHLFSNGSVIEPTPLAPGENLMDAECYIHPVQFLEIRYFCSGIFGFFLATLGVLANCSVIFVFFGMANRPVSTMILQALAFFDICVLVCYVYLYSLQFIFKYKGYASAFVQWVQLVPYIYPYSRISQAATVYIMLAATVERTISLLKRSVGRQILTKRSCYILLTCVILTAVVFHITRFWEITVNHNPNCTGFALYALQGSDLLQNPVYNKAYSVWFNNISLVIVPFALLLCLTIINIRVFSKITGRSRQQRINSVPTDPQDRYDGMAPSMRRQQIRDTTISLIVLVVTYLTLNSPGLVLSLMEFIDPDFLMGVPVVYVTSVAVVNLCAITNSSTRFINYCVFNRQFRATVKDVLYQKFGLRRLASTNRGTHSHYGENPLCFSNASPGISGSSIAGNGELPCYMKEENANSISRNGVDLAKLYPVKETMLVTNCYTKDAETFPLVDDNDVANQTQSESISISYSKSGTRGTGPDCSCYKTTLATTNNYLDENCEPARALLSVQSPPPPTFDSRCMYILAQPESFNSGVESHVPSPEHRSSTYNSARSTDPLDPCGNRVKEDDIDGLSPIVPQDLAKPRAKPKSDGVSQKLQRFLAGSPSPPSYDGLVFTNWKSSWKKGSFGEGNNHSTNNASSVAWIGSGFPPVTDLGPPQCLNGAPSAGAHSSKRVMTGYSRVSQDEPPAYKDTYIQLKTEGDSSDDKELMV